MGGDKCRGLGAKARKAYDKYRKARETMRSSQVDADEACDAADRECAVEKFEGKTGEALKKAIDNCRDSGRLCDLETTRAIEAGAAFEDAETMSDAAQDALSKCEHKKKSGRKK